MNQLNDKNRLNPDLVPKLSRKQDINFADAVEEPWNQGTASADSNRATLVIGVATSVVLLLAFCILLWPSDEQGVSPSIVVDDTLQSATFSEDTDNDNKATLLYDCLVAFFATDSIEDKLRLIRDPERLQSKVERWASRQESTIMDLASLRFSEASVGSLEAGGRKFDVLNLTNNERLSWTIYFEEGKNGSHLLDWESLIGCGDMLLPDFAILRPSDSTLLRVIVQRSGYYNYGFAPEVYQAFSLSNVDRSVTLVAYAKRRSPALSKLLRLRESIRKKNNPRKLSLNVRFTKIADGIPQPEIVGFISDGWLDN